MAEKDPSQSYQQAGASSSYVSPSDSSTASLNVPGEGEKIAGAGSGVDRARDVAFNCDQCSKSFNRRENLSRHLKTHDTSKSHCCSKCGKGFTRSDLLKRHVAGHDRWDQGGDDRRSANAKRRRVAFKPGSESEGSVQNGPGKTSLPLHLNPMPSPEARDVYDPEPSMSQIMDSNEHIMNYQNVPTQQADSLFAHVDQGQAHHRVYPHPNLGNEPTQQDYQGHVPMDNMMPFDFSSFLLPTDVGPVGHEWFSYDFYSAMRETGNEWGVNEGWDLNMSTPGQDYASGADFAVNQPVEAQPPLPEQGHSNDGNVKDVTDHPDEHGDGRISRVSSPPNEASEEDKWPFQWNPNSRAILKAHAIDIPNNHLLFRNHDPRFDITEATLMRLKSFLHPPSGREFHQSQKGTFILPSLPILNIFIRLFFLKFIPQMPVLHLATVNTNHLPPPLLASMIIIGAIYSHVKHTRRFAIVLLDVVRWHLRIALECDNSLMRDPNIIYAEALICHTGLWCGNKRAFELAEVVRGALITYIRRMRFGDYFIVKPSEAKVEGNLQAQWTHWISEESQRRLVWVVYGIDSQFPSLLNLPPSLGIGELRNVGCPCDEEFWCATSARQWKNLLGPASIPPSRSFSAAVGPFILVTSNSSTSKRGPSPGYGTLSALNLNPWSAFLVLISLTHQIYQFSENSMIAQTFDHNEDDDPAEAVDEDLALIRRVQEIRRAELADALRHWSAAYSSQRAHLHPSSLHFHASSIVLHNLTSILLSVPLSDLQSAIGKDGLRGMTASMSNLTLWAHRSPSNAETTAIEAVRSILLLDSLSKDDPLTLKTRPILYAISNTDTAPYSLIAVFLCHVLLWAFASVSPHDRKAQFLKRLREDPQVRESGFVKVLTRALGLGLGGDGDGALSDPESKRPSDLDPRETPKIMFRSAAEMLARLGTWGASLNLALLLHKRSEN